MEPKKTEDKQQLSEQDGYAQDTVYEDDFEPYSESDGETEKEGMESIKTEDESQSSPSEGHDANQEARDYLKYYLETCGKEYKETDHEIIEAHPERENNNCHGYTLTGAPASLDADEFLSEDIGARLAPNTVVFWNNSSGIAHSGIREGSWIRHYLIGVGILRSNLSVIKGLYAAMYTLPAQLDELKKRQEASAAKSSLSISALTWAMKRRNIDFPNEEYVRKLIEGAQGMSVARYEQPHIRFLYRPIEEASKAYGPIHAAYLNQELYEETIDEKQINELLNEADEKHILLWRLRGVLPDEIQPYEHLRLRMEEEKQRAQRVAQARK